MSKSAPRGRTVAPRQPSLLSRPIVLAVAAITLLATVFVIILASKTTEPTATTPSTPIDTAAYDKLQPSGTALGAANAPITIVEYSDFQCPFCKRADVQMVDPLKEEYILSGKVRFEYRTMAFLGRESLLAANASWCAADQGRFWPYHDKLFAQQAGENQNTFSNDNLKRWGQELGLNTTQFNACVDTLKHSAKVQAVNDEAQQRNVSSTPTFFVNDQRIDGLVDYAQLRQIIEGQK